MRGTAFSAALAAAISTDWSSTTSSDGSGEPKNISDKVDADKRLDLTVSEDGKTLSGTVLVYCKNLTSIACQGAANSMSQINQTTNDLTIDITVETTSNPFLADIETEWVNYTSARTGDSTRLNSIFGAYNKIRLKYDIGYGVGVRSLTPAHEIGHAIGLWHQANSTNSLMSYSPNKINSLTDIQMKNLFEAYKQ